MIKSIFLIFITIVFLCSHSPNRHENINSDTLKYIFIGHPYQNLTDGSKVDYRLESFDFSNYDGIWLGGDVCSEASLKYSTVRYIDSLFNLSNPMTFWTLGNHDTRNGNWHWIEQFTNRKTYYAHYNKGITFLVLNTNIVPADCYNMEKQYEIIKNVCDTISESSHLILLMHHGLWVDIPGLPPPRTYAHSELTYWNSHCGDVNSNFKNSIYPKLITLKSRGIEPVCLIGDMGANLKTFSAVCDNGIVFAGCGLDKNSPDDKVLVFSYIDRTLSMEFQNLDSLLSAQKNKID